MPLFGKKKEEKKPMSDKPSYPTQGYPSQGGYPTQGPSAPPQGPPQGAYGGPPPPQNMYGPPPPYGQPPPYQQYPGHPPPPAQYAGPQYAPAPQTVYVQQGAFDAGARFDGVAQPTIPPPPPGTMPNAAQLAAASGQPVSVNQNKSNFFTGGSDGGYVIW